MNKKPTPRRASRRAATPCSQFPRICGVGRDGENHKAIVVYFERELTNDEMRQFHDGLRTANVRLHPEQPAAGCDRVRADVGTGSEATHA